MARKNSFKNRRTNSEVKYYGNAKLTEPDLENEYLNSPLSLKDLAAKYEITYTTLKNLSAVNGWANKKRKQAIDTAIKVNDIVSDDIIDYKTRIIKRNYEQLAKTQDLIQFSIDKMASEKRYNLQELLCLIKCFEGVNKICTGDVGERNNEEVTLSKLDTLLFKIKSME